MLVINVLPLVSKLIPHCLICENEPEPLYSGPVLSNMMLGFAGGGPWTIILKESALYSLGSAPTSLGWERGILQGPVPATLGSQQLYSLRRFSREVPWWNTPGKELSSSPWSFLHHPSLLWRLPGWNLKLSPIHGGQEETKERGQSRLGGGRFNRQGNFQTRLVFSSHRASGSLHPYARVF